MQPLALTRKKLSLAEFESAVQELVTWLASHVSPNKIYLFGSAATGQMTDQSDLDLLLVYDNQKDIKAAQKIAYRGRPVRQFPVDFVWMTESEFASKKDCGGVAFLAVTEGRLVFAAKESSP